MAGPSVLADLASFVPEALRSFGWYWKVPLALLAVGFLFRAVSGTRFGAEAQGLGGLGKRLVGCGTVLLAIPFALVGLAIALALLAGWFGFREG
jgi:hypothetical protein